MKVEDDSDLFAVYLLNSQIEELNESLTELKNSLREAEKKLQNKLHSMTENGLGNPAIAGTTPKGTLFMAHLEFDDGNVILEEFDLEKIAALKAEIKAIEEEPKMKYAIAIVHYFSEELTAIRWLSKLTTSNSFVWDERIGQARLFNSVESVKLMLEKLLATMPTEDMPSVICVNCADDNHNHIIPPNKRKWLLQCTVPIENE
ncbi:hypothetical protein [Kamptonema sp. UHCC 0994]|uniref:hypothetical protein n=1 Tax=Kamptonema sp. UHCC 0994 TaxID=3031329 RepID=UPI0023B93965|nr:hypothetical protein [Kamptonema sp. UHCC 0994]MDF0553147.1 hypothetical protein [Kamptonema sp. UHCC 0994]